ncbi:MAG: NAD(P)-dependent oxidoreductase [Clostridia bacterium]|nr:NAD(P)-dependent oxidoreductase [Clostridia bacterium]
MQMECPGRKTFQADVEACAVGGFDFELFQNATFFITGATGLVGGAVVRALLAANRIRGMGARILAPVRSIEKAKKVFGEAFDRKDIRFFECDLNSPIEIFEPVDFIVHAASVTQSKLFVTKPVETIEAAVLSTMNVLSLAREKRVRGMVYISSMEAFGVTDPKLEFVSEKDLGYVNLQAVRSCYPESKRMCENLTAAYAHEYGVPVCAARLAQTFGAGVSASDTRAFMQFAESALSRRDIVLHTKGESYGNYVCLKDAVSAILLLITRGESGDVYTVSNQTACVQIKELAKIAAETLSDPPVKVIFDIPDDPMKYGYAPDVKMHLSNRKLCSLGWQATDGLKEMFVKMAEDLKEQAK